MLSKEQIEAEFEKAIKGDSCRLFDEVWKLAAGGRPSDAAGRASTALTNIARSGQKLCSGLYEEVRDLRARLSLQHAVQGELSERLNDARQELAAWAETAEVSAAAECAEQEYLMGQLADTTEQLIVALRENAALKVKLERATGESA